MKSFFPGATLPGFSRGARLVGSIFAAAALLGPSSASAWVFGNGNSSTNKFSMSGNGRYVVFESVATNLVANDTNGLRDIFRLDTQTGEVVRVNVASSGAQATGAHSFGPSISTDGTKVAFRTFAANLVSGDTNGQTDVFVRDLSAGTTVRASVDSAGNQATGGASTDPSLSSDGTKVAFESAATDLVSGDTNDQYDVFVRDLSAGTTVRASVDSSGNQATGGSSDGPSLSSDGTKVAFESAATNLVPGDTNGFNDVFVRDLSAGTTTRGSVDSSGAQATGGIGNSFTPSISSDGTKVAYYSGATNLVSGDTNGQTDVFVRDLSAGTTVRASVDSSGNQTDSSSNLPSISSDGTKVAFQSYATNLVSGDTNGQYDVFVRDLSAGTTVRASVDSAGNQATGGSSSLPSISSDGTKVAFESAATNLVPDDTNGFTDVFVRDLSTGSTSVPVTLSGFGLE